MIGLVALERAEARPRHEVHDVREHLASRAPGTTPGRRLPCDRRDRTDVVEVRVRDRIASTVAIAERLRPRRAAARARRRGRSGPRVRALHPQHEAVLLATGPTVNIRASIIARGRPSSSLAPPPQVQLEVVAGRQRRSGARTAVNRIAVGMTVPSSARYKQQEQEHHDAPRPPASADDAPGRRLFRRSSRAVARPALALSIGARRPARASARLDGPAAVPRCLLRACASSVPCVMELSRYTRCAESERPR